jgi:antitoxin (DNA-binding transcriptional repressor) of toxin-antitoxin stability system
MRSVALEVLENQLREYVRLAASGERVLVTDRDRVVAELRPPEGRGTLAADAMLAEAMRRGWLSAPLTVRETPPPRMPVAPVSELLRELDADGEAR